MILKKPYAFLIKHFRMIHVLLLACVIYVFYNITNIRTVYNTLAASKTFTYLDAMDYFNPSVFFILIVAILLSLIVTYLLKVKKKPALLYFLTFTYFIACVALFIYLRGSLNALSLDGLTEDDIRRVRDLTMLFGIPFYPFSIMLAIRSVGFNLKQFNFKKDIKDMQISDDDSGEYEVTFGKNSYKYMRLLRRFKREIKYYFVENKFAIYMVLIVVILVSGSFGVYFYNKNIVKVGTNSITLVDNIFITVNDSYVTENNSNGHLIKEGSKFVIIDLSLMNSSMVNASFDLNKLSLSNGQLIYRPTTTYNSSFLDLGTPLYKSDSYETNVKYNKLIVFEVPESVKVNGWLFRLENGLTEAKENFISNYTNFRINPKNLDSSKNIIESELNKSTTMEYLDNKFTYNFTNYSIQDVYNNKYVLCKNLNDCSTISSLIAPENLANNSMIVIDYSALINEESPYSVSFPTVEKVFQNYLTLTYSNGIYNVTDSVTVLKDENIEGKIFLIVDRRVASASYIALNFEDRVGTTIIPLKY